MKIDAICEKITLNVKKLGSLNVSNISTLNVLKSMCKLYVDAICEHQFLMLAKSLNGKLPSSSFIYDNSPHNAFVCELGYM